MKKALLLLALLISFSAIVSCSADEDSKNSSKNRGVLTVNGVEKPINKGYIIPIYKGSDENIDKTRFYYILTNGDLTLQNNELVYSDNVTQLVDINMLCSTEAPGSEDEAIIERTEIATNMVIQNGKFVSGNKLNSDDKTSDTRITIKNGIYTISFSFSDDQNNITGSYTGTMTKLKYQY